MIGNDEGRALRDGQGRRLTLGALLKSGAAGSVYRVREYPRLVAKLYHLDVDLAMYERKVAAMLELSPELPDLSEGNRRYVQIAWPSSLLRDERGRFLGYLMPAVDVQSTSELECVMQEKQARALGLPTGLGAKITLAANLAGVIAELHRQQHRVVDLKPVNLRFYPSSLYMAMLDCDGFSIQGRGERFLAPQYTTDYLAPEFQAGGLQVAGEETQDRFALAVIVFQLLNFGIHPFTGRPANDAVPTDIPGRIAARLYPYGLRPNARLLPSPASGHQSMPADLRQLFDRAFDGPAQVRPSALEWGNTLRAYAQRSSLKLAHCSKVADHQHFAGLACGACARAALIGKTARDGQARGRLPPPFVLPGRAPASPQAPRPSRIGRWRPTNVLGRQRAPTTAPRPRPAWPQYGTLPPPSPPPPSGLLSNMSLFDLFRLLLFGAVVVTFGLIQLFEKVNRDNSHDSSRYEPPPPPAPIATPFASAPPLDQIQPIATHGYQPIREGLPQWMDIERTRDAALWVAVGKADENHTMVRSAMDGLNRALPANVHSSQASRATDETRLLIFSPEALQLDEGQRLYRLRGLEIRLDTRTYDAESACEWAWLALLAGKAEFARDTFLRAIWADPQLPCGWDGFAALAEDTRTTYGALVMAETLHAEDLEAAHLRDGYMSELLQRSGGDPTRWQILDARARVRVAPLRQTPLPKEIERRAKLPLPAGRPEESEAGR